MLAVIMVKFSSSKVGIVHKYHNHGTLIELVWTITPALILVAIAFPSFKLLYLMDEVISPTMTVKVAGHQWYWSTHQTTSDYQSSLCLDSNTSADHVQLAVLSGITSMSLQCADVDVRSLTPQDIPCVPSKNHENTLAVLEHALLSDLFSTEVRDFITSARGQEYSSLCHLSPNGDLIIPERISLGFKGQLPLLDHQSGIYVITLNGTNDGYIGSTIDFTVRLRAHRDLGASSQWLSQQHLLYSPLNELGPDAFTFTVLHPTTHFVTAFHEAYPDFDPSVKDSQLLEAFTKYELALVEQAYLDRFKPSLNGRFIATTSTHPHLLSPISDSLPPITIQADPESMVPLDSTTPQMDISH